MGLDLKVRIGNLTFKNPVWVASGTFGHAKEFESFIDLKKLGGIVTKTITLKPRLGKANFLILNAVYFFQQSIFDSDRKL